MTLAVRTTLQRAVVLSAAAIAIVVSAGAAQAQVHPDAKTGKAIAEKLCVGCHIVSAATTGAAMPTDVAPFVVIANKPGQTAQAIAGAIVVPHPPMPQIQLTREEIGDIAAYILTLRK